MSTSRNGTLDAIGLKNGTDKASSDHDYLNFYEMFFSLIREDRITVLEIGIFNGASLQTWEEYFSNAKVIGADILPITKRFERRRVKIEILDQSNVEELTRLAVQHGPFDVIIEDGSHIWEHQITSLRTLFPFLKDGGFYIVEDLQTNYGLMEAHYKGVGSQTCMNYLKAWADLRVADDQTPIEEVEDAFLRTYGRAVQFIAFYRRACLIKKRFLPIDRKNYAGSIILPRSGQPEIIHIFAHVSDKGDILGESGFVNFGSDLYALQGLSIDCNKEVLEYRIRWPDQAWSEWSRENAYIGTRGKSELLTGVAVRLLENAKPHFTLRTIGLFAGSSAPVEVLDGEDCVSNDGGALCGLQIDLISYTP